jgi:hypothetical protein
MRQIDRARGGLPDFHSVDLAFELIGEIVAAVGPRRRCRQCGKPNQRGQNRTYVQFFCHKCPRAIEARAEDSCKRPAVVARAITAGRVDSAESVDRLGPYSHFPLCASETIARWRSQSLP